jgi:hypothetical protein
MLVISCLLGRRDMYVKGNPALQICGGRQELITTAMNILMIHASSICSFTECTLALCEKKAWCHVTSSSRVELPYPFSNPDKFDRQKDLLASTNMNAWSDMWETSFRLVFEVQICVSRGI